MRFGVLGPLAVWTDEGVGVPIPGFKVRVLLAALLLHRGRYVSVSRLVDDLWGEALPRNPEGALQSKVSQLRRALGDAEAAGRDLVRYRSGGYVLEVDAESVDQARFEAMTERAHSLVEVDPQEAVAVLDEALALWRGPALDEFDGMDFARPAISGLAEARLAAAEDRLEALLALGEAGAAAAELGRLVGEHPLRERLRALHMRALYQAGRQTEALDSFHDLRTRLADELGIDPTAGISGLYRSILAHDDALQPPVVAATDRPRTNLAAPRTTTVGREGAVERIRHLLARSRLVTLTGTGGVGKTRLALEAAAAVADEFPDGVWVVELAAHGQDEDGDQLAWVVEQAAGVLGVQDDTTDATGDSVAALTDRVASALRQQETLLVLDDCDHVVVPVARLVDRLLGAAGGLGILATSRRPLGIAGEQLWSVPPLAVPDPDAPPDPGRLQRFDAVALFVQRATAADQAFALTEDNAAAVADICRRLDGVPLALELAAARTRAVPVAELAERLGDRFRLLSAGAVDAPERQQTLQALVDWSWELLSGTERAVLRRLAVFAGGASLPAAEAVCAGGEVEVSDVLDAVAGLVDHSLLVVEDTSVRARYRMLETIRSYGLDRLEEAGEQGLTRQRHARFYTDFAETADEGLRGAAQRDWLRRLDAETADVRAAIECAAHHEPGLALRAASAMAWYWYLRGRQGEASRLLGLALGCAGPDAPLGPRARALAWQGALAAVEADADGGHRSDALAALGGLEETVEVAHARLLLGGLLRPWAEVPDGTRLTEQALRAFRAAGDAWGAAAALSVRGWLALGRGDHGSAERDGEESQALFTEVGCRWGQARAAELLGHSAEISGDYERAAALYRAALDAAEGLGLRAVAAMATARLGRVAALRGEYAEAVRLHERALRIARDVSLEQGAVFARVGLGLVLRRQGRLDEAEAQLRGVLDWHFGRGLHSGTALCLAELGFIAELRGDAAQANDLHLQSLEAAEDSGEPRALALAIEGLAGAAVAEDAAGAATLLGAAAALRESATAPLPPAERADVDRIAAAAVARLGEDAYAAAFGEGEALGPEEALRLARDGSRRVGSRPGG